MRLRAGALGLLALVGGCNDEPKVKALDPNERMPSNKPRPP